MQQNRKTLESLVHRWPAIAARFGKKNDVQCIVLAHEFVVFFSRITSLRVWPAAVTQRQREECVAFSGI